MVLRTMTKKDLIRNVQDRLYDVPAKDITFAVNVIFNAMKEALKRDERIDVRGFGNFTVRLRAARIARNPKSGSRVALEERRTPFFKAGRDLQKRINAPE